MFLVWTVEWMYNNIFGCELLTLMPPILVDVANKRKQNLIVSVLRKDCIGQVMQSGFYFSFPQCCCYHGRQQGLSLEILVCYNENGHRLGLGVVWLHLKLGWGSVKPLEDFSGKFGWWHLWHTLSYSWVCDWFSLWLGHWCMFIGACWSQSLKHVQRLRLGLLYSLIPTFQEIVSRSLGKAWHDCKVDETAVWDLCKFQIKAFTITVLWNKCCKKRRLRLIGRKKNV